MEPLLTLAVDPAAAPVVGLTAAVAGHLATARLVGRGRPLRPLAIGLVAGAGAAVGFFLARSTEGAGDAGPRLGAALLTYAALGFCYFAFVNLNITSLRIRMLRELHGRPDGLPVAALLRLYDAEQVIDLRLGRLRDWGQLERRGERFHVRARWSLFMILSATLRAAKRVVFGRRGAAGRQGLPPGVAGGTAAPTRADF